MPARRAPRATTRSGSRSRARVYEQVLREGTADDVRFFVDADRLLELWNELVLPPAVREAWTGWIERRRLAA